MQAFIVVVLLIFYGVALFLPAVKPDAELDEAMKQTLLNLVIAAVSYYIGTSAGAKPPEKSPPTDTYR